MVPVLITFCLLAARACVVVAVVFAERVVTVAPALCATGPLCETTFDVFALFTVGLALRATRAERADEVPAPALVTGGSEPDAAEEVRPVVERVAPYASIPLITKANISKIFLNGTLPIIPTILSQKDHNTK